ncbi:MAG: hypothetical protein KKG76_03855 [Euryarchaeota archaeon]|nr:hypothetical protein [Euryarchaeota archaeon]
MEIADAILVTIKAAGDCISGRTTIQKLIYFESLFKLVDANYRPHYYGPYSSEISSSIQELTYLDFVKEEVETRETTGFTVSNDWKRYCYTISNDGNEIIEHIKKEHPEEYKKIINLVKVCKDTANLDVNILSWAAKVNYILSKQGTSLTPDEITIIADSFGWKLSQPQIDNAVELLKKLDLCQAE